MPAVKESPRRAIHSSADRELLTHSKCARGRGSTPEYYVTTVAEQRIGTVATRYASGGVSRKRKDIPSGESASRGIAPTNG